VTLLDEIQNCCSRIVGYCELDSMILERYPAESLRAAYAAWHDSAEYRQGQKVIAEYIVKLGWEPQIPCKKVDPGELGFWFANLDLPTAAREELFKAYWDELKRKAVGGIKYYIDGYWRMKHPGQDPLSDAALMREMRNAYAAAPPNLRMEVARDAASALNVTERHAEALLSGGSSKRTAQQTDMPAPRRIDRSTP
jgi:hypothetical protein